MPFLSPITANNANQWLALFDSSASMKTGTVHQFHERHLAQHGAEFMAQVYRVGMERLLENACAMQRPELCNTFRRVMSNAIDAHFAALDLADASLCLSLADNAKEWLTFMHCMLLAEKISFEYICAGFLSTYSGEFMAQAYLKTFEHMLHDKAPGESFTLLSTLQQALSQACETTACYAAA